MEEIYPYKTKYLTKDGIFSTENYIYVRMEYGKKLMELYFCMKCNYFLLKQEIRMAYGRPLSRSCGGLEGPFGPCWEPLAPS